MRVPLRRTILMFSLLAGLPGQAAAQVYPGEVKLITRTVSGSNFEGVVGAIDADRMTLVETTHRGEVQEHTFTPIDLLRKGETLSNGWGCYAYRWKDVKAGDTVSVQAVWDTKDMVWYCAEIMIKRRPKDKLPKSQKPDEDHSFLTRSVRNDIENGLDVSDEEVLKAFPVEKEQRDSKGRITRRASPGGLDKEWQAKLDAIRAKAKKDKEKDSWLKATPPEKK